MNHPLDPDEKTAAGHVYADDASATRPVKPVRGWRRSMRATLAAVAAAVLLGAGLLTHFLVRPGHLAEMDISRMRMQRMGPPPYLRAVYSQLNSDTVAVRSSSGKIIATGLYVEALAKPASLPGFLSFVPPTLRRLIETDQVTSYAAIFVAPIRGIRSRQVIVDTSSRDLSGVVIKIDKQLGIATIAATITAGQLQGFDYMPFLNAPASQVKLPLLIMRRNPGSLNGSAGFALTSGAIKNGLETCDTTVSGVNSGAPLAYIAPTGKFSFAGLALPSPSPGKCAVVSSWAINRFLFGVTALKPGRTVAFLGVDTTTPALARKEFGYRGKRYGAFVTSVIAGSPAAAAGLRAGDLVVRIDSEPIGAPNALRVYLHRLRPGTAHAVSFVRGGRVQTVRVVLGSIPLSVESG
jgi:hypothetical protein